jgi:hypothetical protein
MSVLIPPFLVRVQSKRKRLKQTNIHLRISQTAYIIAFQNSSQIHAGFMSSSP